MKKADYADKEGTRIMWMKKGDYADFYLYIRVIHTVSAKSAFLRSRVSLKIIQLNIKDQHGIARDVARSCWPIGQC